MKLKKLIVSGFKSFADRTEFEFDDGISCIVGPNGCGKSNVVDAVKWVLGEQSAKSLRGSEMMDVIFNGSAARRPCASADVTLVFDNASGMLQLNIPTNQDASDHMVSITRRLFRGGQSEYLINKTPCRLKDIREMFMDTGIGNDAYGVIEQGRVEGFLQASTEDRRAIFDEAAGISKYKARKKEALRKLERVEQNLLRIRDMLAEVEKRLRSIKYQAGKARNYQAYTERLKELKSLYLLSQYHTLALQRKALQGKMDSVNDGLASVNSMIAQLESAQSATEVESVDLERVARDLQGRIAATSSQITTCQERAEMLRGKAGELGTQILQTAQRCEELEAKIASAEDEIRQRNELIAQLDVELQQQDARHNALRGEHTAGELAIAQLAAQLEDEKAGTIDLLRRTAQLHNEIHGLGIRQENLHGQKSRLTGRAQEIETSLQGMLVDRARVDEKLTDVRAVLGAAQAKLDETRRASTKVHDDEQKLQQELSAARETRSGMISRAQALREMQAHHEGVAGGVKRVLEAHRDGKLPAVRGMLGDFIDTHVEHARIVEAALAGADQQLVLDRFSDLCACRDELTQTLGDSGLAEVQCLDRLGSLQGDLDLSAADRAPAVRGRVIDLVRFDAFLAPLLWRLLGRTLRVATLADAAAAAENLGSAYRFVTDDGEILECDGRIRLGAANKAAGVIARRSELAQLESQLTELDAAIEQLQQQCLSARNERQHLEELQQKLRTAIYEANTERVECESRLQTVNDQIATLQREQPVVAEDLKHLAAEIEAAVHAEHQAKQKADELEQLNQQRQQEVERIEKSIAEARAQQERLSGQITELKVAQAQSQQKKLAAKESLGALCRQRDLMQQDLHAGRSQIELDRQRKADAEQSAAAAQADVERLYAEKLALDKEALDLEETRQGLREKLEQIRHQLTEHRQKQEEISTQLNASRVELSEVDVRIENLIARAADEMGMNLPELFPAYQHDDTRDWEAVNAEIQDLRGKIDRLGSVNLDAIAEQEELEKREQFLTTQLDDITTSQNQLQELIRRINRESRERFVQTFETVRTNFQELFRKLFGGGRADIILTNPEDVLESPIEIVARPPGKELRSLTLLSGGEKTMTALAMLFSIFKSRPSPFCLLDEVDAALDEANNQRFNMLVGEFVSTSQFVIISHSKRTMSAANVLYGVTMQEPGVSKRISVRFEEAKDLDEQLQPA